MTLRFLRYNRVVGGHTPFVIFFYKLAHNFYKTGLFWSENWSYWSTANRHPNDKLRQICRFRLMGDNSLVRSLFSTKAL